MADALDPLVDPLDVTEVILDVVGPVAEELGGAALDRIEDTLPFDPFDPFAPLNPLDPLDPLDPLGNLERIGDGVDWLVDRFGPIAEPIGRPELPPPTGDEDDGWGIVEWVLFALAVDWLLDQEVALSRDFDFVARKYDREDFEAIGDNSVVTQWGETVFQAPAAYAARLGDATMHGDAVAPGIGSANVLIGSKPALRVCDAHVCTKATPVPHTALGFRTTNSTVLVNGFPLLRVGDFVDEGPFGPNPIVSGCVSVTAGKTPPPVSCWTPSAEEPPEDTSPIPFRWERVHLGHVKFTVSAGFDVGGPFLRVKGTVTAAELWAEEKWVTDVPLGDFDGDGKTTISRHTITSTEHREVGIFDFEVKLSKKPKKTVTPKGNNSDRKIEHTHELVEE